ncbi:PREDICTED: aldehyde dehydrogenase family 3 member F1 isoform X1 [Brassica oleracea var. oleracea]|uniref:aldehyde dehydrogenase family 3 member F1 isoform X1 n=1 Tax=Brassica oleracea var. oleracea TaxID=109376 RepID=UPI0006A6F7B2|nr:PREDICTED: aldehyde dehydrogenase family 3 member F1 isoform X1 [Brassica oleracea var. oleracea]
MEEIVDQSLREMRETFASGRTRSVKWRKTQLEAIIEMVKDNEDKMCDVLFQDLGKHSTEAFRDELGFVMRSATTALNCLDKWVVPKKSDLPLLFYPSTGKVISEPYGTVLVLSSWNFPISLSLDPMIGAISAGNTVLLKASELSPNASAFLAKTIPSYLDNKAIKVIEGGPDVATILLKHQWDKIFFTGSPKIGKIIMAAAAEHLTPVTLELGGKCPTIVDHHSVSKDMKIEMLKPMIRSFFGENPKESGCLSRIVTKKHFQRLARLLNDPGVQASIVYGGSMDEEKLYIEPTILLDPPLDSEIMNEEIFGPILPIITLRDIQESIGFIKSKPKPLAIYAFTKDENLKTRILSETSSGSVTFNDVMIQYMCDALPFGGVGESGIGRYHGKYSFECFSHEKAIMEGSLAMDLEARYPPWNSFKLTFLRLAFREAYFKLVLFMLGLKK